MTKTQGWCQDPAGTRHNQHHRHLSPTQKSSRHVLQKKKGTAGHSACYCSRLPRSHPAAPLAWADGRHSCVSQKCPGVWMFTAALPVMKARLARATCHHRYIVSWNFTVFIRAKNFLANSVGTQSEESCHLQEEVVCLCPFLFLCPLCTVLTSCCSNDCE